MKYFFTTICFIFFSWLNGTAQISGSVNSVICVGFCDGSASVNNSPGYRYSWSNGATTFYIDNLCSGTYYCLVSDTAGNRLDSVSLYVGSPPNAVVLQFDTLVMPCTGGNTGIVKVSAHGGNPPYDLYLTGPGLNIEGMANWDGSSTGSNNAESGSFSANVYDRGGCNASAHGTLPQSVNLIVSQAGYTSPSSCFATDGAAPVVVSAPGQPPYIYNWNPWSEGPYGWLNYNGDGSDHILTAGVYTVEVLDQNGCTGTSTVLVNDNEFTAYTQNTNITCHHADSTTLFVNTSDFNVDWGDHNYDPYDTSPSTHAYAAKGNYVIQMDNYDGCIFSMIDTIVDSTAVIGIFEGPDITCFYPYVGELEAYVHSGIPPFSFLWNNAATTADISGLNAGDYALTVTDGIGCTVDTVLHLRSSDGSSNNGYIYLSASIPNCGNSGSITATVYYGTAPYNYKWSNGDSTATITGLAPGNYGLTVTDNGGCKHFAAAILNHACGNVLSGFIYQDRNANCLPDTGEVATSVAGTVTVQGTNGVYYGNTDNTGYYSILVPDSGTFNVKFVTSSCGEAGCVQQQTVYFPGFSDSISGYNFGVQTTNFFNLAVLPGWSSAQPGFTKSYWAYYYNQSSSKYLGQATITITVDPRLVYINSSPPATYNAAQHSLSWTVDSVPINWAQMLTGNFTVPTTVGVGDLLQSSFTITPVLGDCDSSNNSFSVSETAAGSHDPNEKLVSPAVLTQNDSVLTYTIHFQNTGTTSTHFIVVKDTLSPYLDPATAVTVASSATYSDFNVSGKGILTWTFNPLTLPDSLVSVEGSKGFVAFKIKKKADIPLGAVISNVAYIYFDYNDAVVTNVVADTQKCIAAVNVNLNATICQGYNYDFFGTNVTTEGVYTHTHVIQGSCDTAYILNLGVINSITHNDTQTICAGQTYNGYSATGIYTDTLTAITGCDSFRVLHLTVLPVVTINNSRFICAGQVYHGYNTTGVYSDTLTASTGCDSIFTLQLTVRPVISVSLNKSICTGESYNAHSTPGNYVDTLTAVTGCDSIVTLNLSVNATVQTTLSDTICQGDQFTFNSQVLTATGLYNATYTAANNCDSIVTLNLSVFTPDTPVITQHADSLVSSFALAYQWYFANNMLAGYTTRAIVPAQSGSYKVLGTSANTCTSFSAEYFFTSTGINTVGNAFEVSLYPNPNNGSFIVKFSDTGVKEITVTDVLGQSMLPAVKASLKAEFNLNNLAAGVYMLKITDTTQPDRVVLKQVVLQR